MQFLKCSYPGNFIEYIGHDARVTKYPIPYSLKRQIGYLSYSGIMMDIIFDSSMTKVFESSSFLINLGGSKSHLRQTNIFSP